MVPEPLVQNRLPITLKPINGLRALIEIRARNRNSTGFCSKIVNYFQRALEDSIEMECTDALPGEDGGHYYVRFIAPVLINRIDAEDDQGRRCMIRCRELICEIPKWARDERRLIIKRSRNDCGHYVSIKDRTTGIFASIKSPCGCDHDARRFIATLVAMEEDDPILSETALPARASA